MGRAFLSGHQHSFSSDLFILPSIQAYFSHFSFPSWNPFLFRTNELFILNILPNMPRFRHFTLSKTYPNPDDDWYEPLSALTQRALPVFCSTPQFLSTSYKIRIKGISVIVRSMGKNTNLNTVLLISTF